MGTATWEQLLVATAGDGSCACCQSRASTCTSAWACAWPCASTCTSAWPCAWPCDRAKASRRRRHNVPSASSMCHRQVCSTGKNVLSARGLDKCHHDTQIRVSCMECIWQPTCPCSTACLRTAYPRLPPSPIRPSRHPSRPPNPTPRLKYAIRHVVRLMAASAGPLVAALQFHFLGNTWQEASVRAVLLAAAIVSLVAVASLYLF